MSNNESSKKVDSTIIIALISAFVTIIVALIPFFGPKLFPDKPTPTPPLAAATATSLPATDTATAPPTAQPTDTVPVEMDTSTPAPTDAPLPTPTVIPIGNDWAKDCISLAWIPEPKDGQPQPTAGDNGCWQQPAYSFITNNGLQFQDNGKYQDRSAYGLFAPLPGTKGTVTVKVSLQELTRADLIMGIYTQPSLESDGYLIAIPNGNVKKAKILKKVSYQLYNTDVPSAPVDQLDGYTIEFTYTPGSVYASVPGVIKFPTNTVQGQTAQKYLFIGYRTLGPAYVANGTFLSVKLSQ